MPAESTEREREEGTGRSCRAEDEELSNRAASEEARVFTGV